MLTFKRVCAGLYKTDNDIELQCPHELDVGDPDRQWYVVYPSYGRSENNVYGPFDTKREAVAYANENQFVMAKNAETKLTGLPVPTRLQRKAKGN